MAARRAADASANWPAACVQFAAVPDHPTRVAVYCGSNPGRDERFLAAATALGTALADAGHEVVYGGGHVGLMGAVADAALAAGGSVTGVITDQLVASEIAHPRLTTLEVVGSMHERKARMTELADAVVVLPGGFGTLDEAFEVLTWNQLGIVAVPVVFLDVADYYRDLFAFLDRAAESGLLRPAHRTMAQRAGSVHEAVRLVGDPAPPTAPKWLDRDRA